MVEQSGPTLTYPASWYNSNDIYELERRAIFAKHWLLITHSSRLAATGDYLSYTIAGYPFFIIRDKDGSLNAFLNVCRHRAFPVVQKEEGTARVLACKYHGTFSPEIDTPCLNLTYQNSRLVGLNGKLSKAPRFESAPGFNGSEYSLFQVHLRVDARGFVWVNLDAAQSPEVLWETYFDKVDTQPRLKDFDMGEYSFDHAWEMDGEYNWKTLIDNYNECYHCSVAHPGIAKTTNLTTYDVKTPNQAGYIEHYAESKEKQDDNVGSVAPTFLFPNASITMTSPYFYLMRVVPVTATRVSMQYEVYKHKSATAETFESVDKFFKQVESEDKLLCTNAQKNLNAGGYVAGPLHPHNEKGVAHFQMLVKTILVGHRKQEQEQGKTIAPAMRMPENANTEQEKLFCEGLCTQNSNSGILAW